MIADILTVLSKELKEFMVQRSSFRGGWIGMLIFIGVFGILLPLQTGREWVSSPINLIAWSWMPMMIVSSVIADSFAGERERHTLETLLASRLPDNAILFGKIAAAVVYGLVITFASLLIGLITVNVAYGEGQLLFFPGLMVAGMAGGSLLLCLLMAGAGVLISLRASTTRQAQQTLSAGMLLLIAPVFVFPMLPVETQAQVMNFFTRLNSTQVLVLAFAVILAIDILLVSLALQQFKRARLILD